MSEASEESKDIRDIQPDRLIKFRLSPDRFSAEVLMPGLWYTDFDKKIGGRMTLWAIAKTFEGSRFMALPRGFMHFDELKDEATTAFLASSRYCVTPGVNDVRGKTFWGYHKPLHFKFQVTQIGTSSFTFETVMNDATSGQEMMSLLSKFVYVDFKTRKPQRLPDWLMERKKFIKTFRTIEKAEKILVPEDAYKYITKSAFSDTDHNLHVNQAIYVKWCTDAGTSAALDGHYRDFRKDIGMYPVAVMDVQYLGESVVNEDFVIYTWQDLTADRTLRFVITKDGSTVVIIKLTYHAWNESDASRL